MKSRFLDFSNLKGYEVGWPNILRVYRFSRLTGYPVQNMSAKGRGGYLHCGDAVARCRPSFVDISVRARAELLDQRLAHVGADVLRPPPHTGDTLLHKHLFLTYPWLFLQHSQLPLRHFRDVDEK